MATLAEVKKAVKKLDFTKKADRLKARELLNPFENKSEFYADENLLNIYIICGGAEAMERAGWMYDLKFSGYPERSNFPSLEEACKHANSLRRKL